MANPASAGNAVIAKVNLGVIRDCTNSADTEVTVSGSLIFGALVAQNGGTLERCINYGNVTVTQTASASSGFYGGAWRRSAIRCSEPQRQRSSMSMRRVVRATLSIARIMAT